MIELEALTHDMGEWTASIVARRRPEWLVTFAHGRGCLTRLLPHSPSVCTGTDDENSTESEPPRKATRSLPSGTRRAVLTTVQEAQPPLRPPAG